MTTPISLRQVAVEDASIDPAEGVDLFEPYQINQTPFSGIRTQVIDGVAYLTFYSVQPSTGGRIEYVLVARMVAPAAGAKAALERATRKIGVGAATAAYMPDGVTRN